MKSSAHPKHVLKGSNQQLAALVTFAFCCLQPIAAAKPWIQDRVGTTWWSGTTMPQPIPVLSSGLEAVQETATSLTLRRAAEKPVWRYNTL